MAPGMDRDAWATAFGLLATMRPCQIGQVIVGGMRQTPPGEREQFMRWEELFDCVTEIVGCETAQ